MSEIPTGERDGNERLRIAEEFTSHIQRLAINMEKVRYETVLTALYPVHEPFPVPCDSVRFTILPIFGEHENDYYEMYEVRLSFGEESIFTLTYEPSTFSALIGDGQDLLDQEKNFEHADKLNKWIESNFPVTDITVPVED